MKIQSSKYCLFFAFAIFPFLSCMTEVRDRVDPPQILIKSTRSFSNITGATSYDVFQEKPSAVYWDTDLKYDMIDLNDWTEKDILYNQIMVNKEKPRVPHVYIYLNRSDEKGDWKVEFNGKFSDQSRLIISGNGGFIPSAIQNKTVMIFSGNIYLYIKSEKILSQHVKNLSGGIVVKAYPSIGLISMESHLRNGSKSLHFIKIEPFSYPLENENDNTVRSIVGYPK